MLQIIPVLFPSSLIFDLFSLRCSPSNTTLSFALHYSFSFSIYKKKHDCTQIQPFNIP